MRILVIQFILIASTSAHRVVESSEESETSSKSSVATLNTTTLLPLNSTSSEPSKSATSWKIEASYAESKLESNNTDSKEVQSKEVSVERPANSSEEFRPSQHLGSFVDGDTLVFPTRETDFSPVIKKPPTGFIQSPKDHFKASLTKIPKDIFKHYQDFPYKFEPAILTKAKDGWKPTYNPKIPDHKDHNHDVQGPNNLETRPTAEVPVRVPAGGLYKLPDPFKEKPGLGDDDFGLEFSNDGKEHGLKKLRSHPWKNLMHFLTALIPVGIIFSALTPSVISIGPDHQQIPQNIIHRADGTLAQIPPISERCKRRLLCELHSETNYSYSSSRGKKCHRIHCEDPDSLERALKYLLSYRPTT